jgi:hypothetical protein
LAQQGLKAIHTRLIFPAKRHCATLFGEANGKCAADSSGSSTDQHLVHAGKNAVWLYIYNLNADRLRPG